MTYGAAAAMVASFLLAQSPSAPGPPDGVAYEDDLDRYVWVSADSVMTPEGAIKDLEHWRAYLGAFLENELQYKLDQARTLFGPDHARAIPKSLTECCSDRRFVQYWTSGLDSGIIGGDGCGDVGGFGYGRSGGCFG